MTPEALTALAALLRDEGGLLAEALTADPPTASASEPAYGARAAAGPRAAGHESYYALLFEAIREGFLLHYGTGRVVATQDPDLALLAGDRLYALGLERLADLGDLEAVEVLADLISLGAQVNAEGRPQDAETAWAQGAAAVGNGRATRP